MNFYISDLHLGHENVLKLDNRPFSNTVEMEDTIVENWNNVVGRGDTVYILGDLCWKGSDDEWIRILNRLTGNKVLVRGNHDLKSFSPKLRKKFTDIKDYKEAKDNGRRVLMCHYPLMFYRGAYHPNVYMLCGHVHTTVENDYLEAWRKEMRANHTDSTRSCGNIINVGCMMPYMNYTPRTLDELVSVLE